MAAVRLARFNTGRKLIVCFSGAYHGWWDGVMPGLGSERALDDCLTLRGPRSRLAAVIRASRARDRRGARQSGAVVSPELAAAQRRRPADEQRPADAGVDRALRGVAEASCRAVCTKCDVPLIFDEVYTGFRLAPGGGQEYFGVRADMVVYGKTVAGGLPIGVVCGKRPDAPVRSRAADAAGLRGRHVLGTSGGHGRDERVPAMGDWTRGTQRGTPRATHGAPPGPTSTNTQLADAALPLRVVHLGTIWTVLFNEPGRYNWLLQYYLRAKGITLSWVGTGRCLASMDFSRGRLRARCSSAIVEAAREMRRDGWWLTRKTIHEREQRMKVRLIGEMLGQSRAGAGTAEELLLRSHAAQERRPSRLAQRQGEPAAPPRELERVHLLLRRDLRRPHRGHVPGARIALRAAVRTCRARASVPRQGGDAARLQHPQQDAHRRSATCSSRPSPSRAPTCGRWTRSAQGLPLVAQQWFAWTIVVVGGRVAYLIWKFDFRTSMIWYVKLVTDPFTDVIAYFPRRPLRA